MADERSTRWTFIVYPDSAPSDWLGILKEKMIPFCVSPLHDKDMNPTNERKKAHWHVVFVFGSKKSYTQVKEISDSVNGARPEKVHDLRCMIRYLIHRDNPEKYQYEKSEIQGFCGFQWRSYFEYCKEQKYDIVADMLDFIDNNNITEMATFSQYCRTCRRSDWWPLYMDYNRVFDVHIRSLRNGFQNFRCSQSE